MRILMFGLVAGLVGLTGCAGGSQPTPATATPSATSTAPSPTPSTTPSPAASPKPLSRFENDPAVRALRRQYVGLAHAINNRDFDNKDLRISTTPDRFRLLPRLLRSELGNYYAGPTPFTPLAVRRISSTRRVAVVCVLDDGWSLTRKGGKPAEKRSVRAGNATVVRRHGRWQVSSLYQAKHSCQGVKITGVTWQ